MSFDPPNLAQVNSIAYNADLREQLQTLHRMLGDEVTNVANSAMQFGSKFPDEGEKVLKYMSSVASKLSIMLINTKESRGTLNDEEQKNFDQIKSLTDNIGNLQARLNKVLKLVKSVDSLTEQIQDQGQILGFEIMDAQARFREVRADINDLGPYSDNPELENIFENQQQAAKQQSN